MNCELGFRRTCNDVVNWNQDQALSASIYILRTYGPLGFLLKEEGESKNFKTYLGQKHSCTCLAFLQTKELCKHICWLLLKKFNLTRIDSLSWQKGLSEREINDLLYKSSRKTATNNSQPVPGDTVPGQESSSGGDGGTGGTIRQRDIEEDSVCPICLENLLKSHLPVTYCRYGCGNSVHIKCMKIHAEHHVSSQKDTINCPMCRADFGSLEALKKEERNSLNGVAFPVKHYHYETNCEECHLKPIIGNCYKCTVCTSYYLCQQCFNTPVHQEHPFKFRQKRVQKWHLAYRSFGYALPDAMVSHLMTRELKDEDYDTLLQLDSENMREFSSLPEKVIASLPLETVSEHSSLLAPGAQCRICLKPFHIYVPVRKLPCRHKFHRECIDNWLLHCHSVCPVDGTEVWNPLIAAQKKKNKCKSIKKEQSSKKGNPTFDITGHSLCPSNQKRLTLGRVQRARSVVQSVRGDMNLELQLNGTSVILGSNFLTQWNHTSNPEAPIKSDEVFSSLLNQRVSSAPSLSTTPALLPLVDARNKRLRQKPNSREKVVIPSGSSESSHKEDFTKSFPSKIQPDRLISVGRSLLTNKPPKYRQPQLQRGSTVKHKDDNQPLRMDDFFFTRF